MCIAITQKYNFCMMLFLQGTEVVEGIMLNLPRVCDLQVDSKAFAKMHNLRMLQLNYAHLKGNFHCPSKRLRYLEWFGFPQESVPPNLYMENLVALYMPYSSLTELWKGTKVGNFFFFFSSFWSGSIEFLGVLI